MLRYTTDRARPGLIALYDIRPGNGAGQFLQPWSPHGVTNGMGVSKIFWDKSVLCHVGYHPKFDLYWSNSMRDVCRKNRAYRTQPFKVTKGHQK